ncbi:unnamed protein product [marine sediment metagenome]|uniref:Uncharacterized protein n=1 Tax=marine sediment metagenome TaxID=412755 RepID=X1EAP0_9ZZZZ
MNYQVQILHSADRADNELELTAVSPLGLARSRVMDKLNALRFSPAAQVNYRIGKNLLIIATVPTARSVLATLDSRFQVILLTSDDDQDLASLQKKSGDGEFFQIVNHPLVSIEGYAGAFQIRVMDRQQGRTIDLGSLLQSSTGFGLYSTQGKGGN